MKSVRYDILQTRIESKKNLFLKQARAEGKKTIPKRSNFLFGGSLIPTQCCFRNLLQTPHMGIGDQGGMKSFFSKIDDLSNAYLVISILKKGITHPHVKIETTAVYCPSGKPFSTVIGSMRVNLTGAVLKENARFYLV